MIDVTNYGAVGDGSTNDTTAILNAIAAIPTDGDELFFPVGRYKVTSTLDFGTKKGVRVRGGGAGTSYNETNAPGAVILGSTAGMTIVNIGSTTGGPYQLGPTFEHLTVYDNAGGGTCIKVINTNHCTFRNISVRGKDATTRAAAGITFDTGGANPRDCAWHLIEQIIGRYCDVTVNSVQSFGGLLIGGNIIGANSSSIGIKLANSTIYSQHWRIIGLKQDGGGQGVHIDGGNNEIIACQFEKVPIGIQIRGLSSGVTGDRNQLIGNVFVGTSVETGIDIGSNCDSNAIIGCTFSAVATNVIDSGSNTLKLSGATKPTVTGSRGGNAALTSLLSQLASIGLITNSTT